MRHLPERKTERGLNTPPGSPSAPSGRSPPARKALAPAPAPVTPSAPRSSQPSLDPSAQAVPRARRPPRLKALQGASQGGLSSEAQSGLFSCSRCLQDHFSGESFARPEAEFCSPSLPQDSLLWPTYSGALHSRHFQL